MTPEQARERMENRAILFFAERNIANVAQSDIEALTEFALTVRREAMEELMKYARHLDHCPALLAQAGIYGHTCQCGFDDAIRALSRSASTQEEK